MSLDEGARPTVVGPRMHAHEHLLGIHVKEPVADQLIVEADIDRRTARHADIELLHEATSG